jgi:uncharacterized protein YndB with AHSA1/START domain
MVARRETVVVASPEEVWEVVSDPAQLSRWWPGVTRVEEATPQSWTSVLSSPRGKVVRADYSRVEAVPEERIVWRQEVEGSPFERILASALTTLSLTSEGEAGTRATLRLDQRPRGWARFAPIQFRAAASRQVRGALDGLEALFEERAP